ncbi:MAG TPA: cytidine deaminase [Bacteroidota bacterium]|nr:cytidine deaminase [Bacteroidota bacterium]
MPKTAHFSGFLAIKFSLVRSRIPFLNILSQLKLENALVKAAGLAKRNAYAPYSRFRVGAALLTKGRLIFDGCNVENSSFSLTICAERAAVFKAVSAGHTEFHAVAIVSDSSDFLPPCGACLQVLAEFSPKMTVILTNGEGKRKVLNISDLLPTPADLRRTLTSRRR